MVNISYKYISFVRWVLPRITYNNKIRNIENKVQQANAEKKGAEK